MKNSKVLFRELAARISINERQDEIHSMIYLIFENVFNLSRTHVLSEKLIEVHPEHEEKIDAIVQRLNNYEPIQYVLGSVEFFGRTFKVSPSVLIPRPETEELIGVVRDYAAKANSDQLRIIDIGAGSGCIGITLALEIGNASVFATDISNEALDVARINVSTLEANVSFMYHNILKQELPYRSFDVVVSNPPYIPEKEKSDMSRNVLDHEPDLALFVPDDDPLLFYREIAKKASDALVPGGLLAVEINERFGKQVAEIFTTTGFENIQVIKDISGKDRIVTGLFL